MSRRPTDCNSKPTPEPSVLDAGRRVPASSLTLTAATENKRTRPQEARASDVEHGDWCPGYQRTAHRASDLTVDHVVPLAAGGAPFDIANTVVLCRSCNATKGASTGGGVAHTGPRSHPDRASRLCARGRVSPIIPVVDRGPGKVGPWAPTL
ncbi:MAG TPA: HNH endonuclease signature motif containing protein, partial [Actinomycetes bacterium]|nr:HNH endonuclease signature motif containing protein [Actinomycetes bacterium]